MVAFDCMAKFPALPMIGGILLLLLPCSPQAQQRAPLRERIDPSLNLVRVTVTGLNNARPGSLAPGHFTIFENGAEQNIEYFAFDGAPASVAVVWALSDDTLVSEARLAPLVFLETLGAALPPRSIEARFAELSNRQLKDIRFEYFLIQAGRDRRSPPTVVVPFSTDVRKLPRNYPPGLGSFDGIYVGLDVLKEAAFPKKAVVAILDSIDEDGLTTDYYKQYTIRQGVPVYYILAAASASAGEIGLQELADVSGGNGYLATSAGIIEGYLKEIAQGLNSQYVIGYRPSNPARDGKWRKLSVRLEPPPGFPKLQARVPSGYYAPRED
jgi:Ca-activated chloride channel family protein